MTLAKRSETKSAKRKSGSIRMKKRIGASAMKISIGGKRPRSLAAAFPTEKRQRQAPPNSYVGQGQISGYTSSGLAMIGGDSSQLGYNTDNVAPKVDPASKEVPHFMNDASLRVFDGLSLLYVLDRRNVSFTLNQEKTICRWMKKHNGRTGLAYKIEFDGLLDVLGFRNPAYSFALRAILRRKVQARISSISRILKKLGGLVVTKEGKRKTFAFAEWTDRWLREDWDGSITKPYHLTLENCDGSMDVEPGKACEPDAFENLETAENGTSEIPEDVAATGSGNEHQADAPPPKPSNYADIYDAGSLPGERTRPSQSDDRGIELDCQRASNIQDEDPVLKLEGQDWVGQENSMDVTASNILAHDASVECRPAARLDSKLVENPCTTERPTCSLAFRPRTETDLEILIERKIEEEFMARGLLSSTRPMRIPTSTTEVSTCRTLSPVCSNDSTLTHEDRSQSLACDPCLRPYEVIEINSMASWLKWGSQLYAILLTHGAWEVVLGSITEPAIPDSTTLRTREQFLRAHAAYGKEFKEWNRVRGIALGWMLLTMGADMRDETQGHKYPKELWDALKERFWKRPTEGTN